MNHLFCCSVFDKTKFDNYDQSKLEAQYSVCIVCLIDKTYCVLYIVFVKCKIITWYILLCKGMLIINTIM